MRKKKFHPQAEQHQDFTVLEISTTMEDYMLAFKLNRKLSISLSRETDLPVYFGTGSPVFYTLYYHCKDQLTEYYLVRNINDQTLLENLFLMIIRGHISEIGVDTLMASAAEIDEISDISRKTFSGASKQDKSTKLISAVLTDLEYHMMEIKRKKDETKVKLKSGQGKSARKLY